MGSFIDLNVQHKNLWFCVNILDKKERRKEDTKVHNIVWADLDTCDPKDVSPPPNVVIRSSPERYQALWKLDQNVAPEIAEDYSKRIAYKYNQNGADPSGWDLTQLLRVPFTKNFKYEDEPLVIVLPDINNDLIPVSAFESITVAPLTRAEEYEEGMPEISTLLDPDKIFYKYQNYLEHSFYEIYETVPSSTDDWSTRMWKLINMGFEAGMETEEVFSVAVYSKTNKYQRDNRPLRFLWREVLKARSVQQKIEQVTSTWEPLLMPELVQPDEYEEDTFIDTYVKWATAATDAVPMYHELAGAILLSSVLAGSIRLDVDYGSLIPNLWGLILGESTLTRKTTAMGMAVSILQEVDPEIVLATDGSAEGLLTGLSNRPGRVSLFYKDEVSGFFDSINRKDYLAGMPETLTQLYDVPPIYKRVLRKETILISNPVFIFFGGGIRDKVYSHLTDEYILSGFLPRFLVVGGLADLERIRNTGPQSQSGFVERQRIVNQLLDAREQYQVSGTMKIAGQEIEIDNTSHRSLNQAILTDEAWKRYHKVETTMVEVAYNSYLSTLALPTFERLSRSVLKLAVLLAASRQVPKERKIEVAEIDVIQAARFIQRWGHYSIELILNVGKTPVLRLLDKVRRTIENKPGIMKSEILRQHHVSSRELNEVIINLIDRGEIKRKVKGRSEQYWIVS